MNIVRASRFSQLAMSVVLSLLRPADSWSTRLRSVALEISPPQPWLRRHSDLRLTADFASGASSLFANVRLPASILAGALVPLGFGFALPMEGPAYTRATRMRIIRVHRVASVVAYASLLSCIVYASVSINSLAETAHEPASSVVDLIRHEYSYSWIATNVTFLVGLTGALLLVVIRVLLTYEADEGRVAVGFCVAALLLMASTVDEQVRAGGYASDLPSLVALYLQMSTSRALGAGGALMSASLLVACASTVAAGVLISSPVQSTSGAGTSAPDLRAADQSFKTLSTLQVDAVTSAVGMSGAVDTASSGSVDASASAAELTAEAAENAATGSEDLDVMPMAGAIQSDVGQTQAADAPAADAPPPDSSAATGDGATS